MTLRRPLGGALAACLGLAAVSCEAPSPPAPPAAGSTAAPPGSVAAARVGDVSIGADQVARIAAAQGVSPAEARDLAVRDALFAAEASARGLSTDVEVAPREDALLARALVQDIMASAEARGPVTDAELDLVTARHWLELDRPDAARTVHAVVVLKAGAPADVRARAAALAESIRRSISPAADVAQHTGAPEDAKASEDQAIPAFRKAVTSVAKGDLDVRVEALAPVVADGRTLTGEAYEKAYAQAAVALARRGDVSRVVESSFGYHVILLLERIPGESVPREERRARVRDEVMTMRAHRAKEDLLAKLRPTVSISKSTDALLALVPVER